METITETSWQGPQNTGFSRLTVGPDGRITEEESKDKGLSSGFKTIEKGDFLEHREWNQEGLRQWGKLEGRDKENTWRETWDNGPDSREDIKSYTRGSQKWGNAFRRQGLNQLKEEWVGEKFGCSCSQVDNSSLEFRFLYINLKKCLEDSRLLMNQLANLQGSGKKEANRLSQEVEELSGMADGVEQMIKGISDQIKSLNSIQNHSLLMADKLNSDMDTRKTAFALLKANQDLLSKLSSDDDDDDGQIANLARFGEKIQKEEDHTGLLKLIDELIFQTVDLTTHIEDQQSFTIKQGGKNQKIPKKKQGPARSGKLGGVDMQKDDSGTLPQDSSQYGSLSSQEKQEETDMVVEYQPRSPIIIPSQHIPISVLMPDFQTLGRNTILSLKQWAWLIGTDELKSNVDSLSEKQNVISDLDKQEQQEIVQELVQAYKALQQNLRQNATDLMTQIKVLDKNSAQSIAGMQHQEQEEYIEEYDYFDDILIIVQKLVRKIATIIHIYQVTLNEPNDVVDYFERVQPLQGISTELIEESLKTQTVLQELISDKQIVNQIERPNFVNDVEDAIQQLIKVTNALRQVENEKGSLLNLSALEIELDEILQILQRQDNLHDDIVKSFAKTMTHFQEQQQTTGISNVLAQMIQRQFSYDDSVLSKAQVIQEIIARIYNRVKQQTELSGQINIQTGELIDKWSNIYTDFWNSVKFLLSEFSMVHLDPDAQENVNNVIQSLEEVKQIQIVELESGLNSFSTLTHILSQAVEIRKQNLSDITRMLSDMKSKVLDADNQINHLTTQQGQIKRNFENNVQIVSNRLKEANGISQKLQQELLKKQQELESLSSGGGDVFDKDQLSAQIQEMHEKIDENSKQIRKVKMAIRKQDSAIRDIEEELEQNTSPSAVLDSIKTETAQKQQEQEQQLLELQEQLEVLNSKAAELEQVLAEKSAELESLQSNISIAS